MVAVSSRKGKTVTYSMLLHLFNNYKVYILWPFTNYMYHCCARLVGLSKEKYITYAFTLSRGRYVVLTFSVALLSVLRALRPECIEESC